MKRKIKVGAPFLFLLLAALALMSGGCGGSGSSRSESAGLNVLPDDFAHFFEELDIELADVKDENITDGTLANLIASGDVVLNRLPHGDNVEGALILRNVHSGGGFIVLLRPNRRGIDVLHEVLNERFGVKPPDTADDGRPILLYALGRRADGGARVYVGMDSLELMKNQTFGGDPTEDPDGAAGEAAPPLLSAEEEYRIRLSDFRAFADWVRAGDLKIVPKSAGNLAAGEPMNNLLDLASAYTSTVRYNPWNKNIQINVYSVSMHDFSTRSDWYWVKEETILDGSHGFKPEWREEGHYTSQITGDKIWVGGGECVENFMYEYTIDNSTASATLHQSSPEAANNVQQHTTGMNFGLGASVTAGYATSSPTATGTLSANVGFSDSTTWTTTDMSVMKRTGQAGDGNPSVGWRFYCTNLPKRGSLGWELTDALPALSHSAYSPSMEWVWSFANTQDVTASRDHTLHIDIGATRAGVYTYWSGSRKPVTKKSESKTSFEVALKKPPDFALEKTEINIGGQAPGEFIGVAAEGGWTAEVADGDWLQISATPETLTVYADPNTSGLIRKGSVLVRRNSDPRDGTPTTATITVTQTP